MPLGYSSPFANAARRSTAPNPITNTGQPRKVREGNYIVTYAPGGGVISRVYSPVQTVTQNVAKQQAQKAAANEFVSRFQPAAVSKPQTQQTTKGLFAGQSSGSGGGGSSSGGSYVDNSFDVFPAGTSGSGATGGSGGTANPSANSGVVYDRAFKGISDKQADYMVANPLAIAAKVFGMTPEQMANNPTIAGLLSPVLEAAQNPFIGALMNPGATGAYDQNQELNFAADLLKQYTTPGGSFLSPTMGLRNIQTAMGDPNSALNAVLSTATGDGAAGAATQFSLFQQLMAPLLSMGTGAWGSDIFDAIGYDAYNKYTLGQAATPGLPKQDFLSALMAAYGYPGTLK